MNVIVVYIALVLVGVVALVLTFIRETREGTTAPLPLAPQPVLARQNNASAPEKELKDIKEALVEKLDQKCVKLEQILDEKNRILDRLQKDLESERSHRNEFEGLKAVLQQQIEELKAQNKQLREEIERILQENIRLQSGLASFSSPAAPSVPAVPGPDFVKAEPDDVIPGRPSSTEKEKPVLRDVFKDESNPQGKDEG